MNLQVVVLLHKIPLSDERKFLVPLTHRLFLPDAIFQLRNVTIFSVVVPIASHEFFLIKP